jgi:hypothetical protein
LASAEPIQELLPYLHGYAGSVAVNSSGMHTASDDDRD